MQTQDVSREAHVRLPLRGQLRLATGAHTPSRFLIPVELLWLKAIASTNGGMIAGAPSPSNLQRAAGSVHYNLRASPATVLRARLLPARRLPSRMIAQH